MFALLLAATIAQTPVAKTKVVVFNAAQMKSSKTISGSCWTASIASTRADAYRCMAGNSIHDPCFTINSSTVACPLNATVNRGIRMQLTSPLPHANVGGTTNTAWLMTLASGSTCNLGTGTIIPGYPFYCTADMVCAAPIATQKNAPIFVTCGHPKGATEVTGTTRYLVTTVYQ